MQKEIEEKNKKLLALKQSVRRLRQYKLSTKSRLKQLEKENALLHVSMYIRKKKTKL